MKSIILLALAFLTITATNASQTVQEPRSDNTRGAPVKHAIPNEPAKNWKISATDYRNLLDDCGGESDYGMSSKNQKQSDSEK